MKTKFFVSLVLSLFLLNSCSNEEDDAFVYAGIWSGQYAGNLDSGNWSVRIDINKIVVGTFTSIQSSNSYQITGAISENGVLNATIETSEIVGEFMDNTASGLWTNTTEENNGTWTGLKL